MGRGNDGGLPLVFHQWESHETSPSQPLGLSCCLLQQMES